ncbi:low-temperature-induced 65 kDa protein isoform X2 [Brassica napus]|uniref:low-temperature-induced 65 kDa protein isoform X2 n=1 Tax=Brassica napus TaxID=3708 RepID=UPI00207961D0|nr:low-temperature-induced 65 kDa protein isoform X2 [Brassica napus]
MDSQAQLQRTHAHHHQAEEPIKIHHPEEEGHHEKGPSKVLKKVKEKAKKIKNVLTKHGHGHEHDRGGEQHIPDDHDLDEEDTEDYDVGQQVHGGAPARGKAHHVSDPPMKEEIVPPGTKAFPVVSSSHTKVSEPNKGVEPARAPNASQALPQPVRPSGVSGKEEKRGTGAATMTPHNTPVSLLSSTEDVTSTFAPGEQRKVHVERNRVLEEDPSAPAGGEVGAAQTIAALARLTGTGGDDQLGHGRDLPERRHGFERELPARRHDLDVKSGASLGKDFPIGTQTNQNAERFDQQRGDETHQPDQSSYTDKITSVTSVVADKAAAAKNVVASKLGYSGEGGNVGAETPSSGEGYGTKVASVVTPVYEKVKETGANVMTKRPFSGGTEETHQGQDKGVSAKEYVAEKLSPGEEDKALSEVVAEKLHLGGDTTAEPKKGTVTQSKAVEERLGGFPDPKSEGAIKHGERYAEEGEGGMVDKLTGAVTSWISGTTEEVTQKSTESVQDSSQSVGATIGNMGFSGSGADGAGQRSGEKRGSVPVQKKFQEN